MAIQLYDPSGLRSTSDANVIASNNRLLREKFAAGITGADLASPLLLVPSGLVGIISPAHDNYFGIGANGATGTYMDIGSLGDGSNVWLDARGTPTDIGVKIRAKGAGIINLLDSAVVANEQMTALFFAGGGASGLAFRVGDNAEIWDVDVADALNIRGQQTAANGVIIFGSGGDTNLYRSATDTLKTDDTFIAPNIRRVLVRAPSEIEVANTTTETSIFSQSIPANSMGTDRALALTLMGAYQNSSGSDKQLRLRIKFGGTTIYDDNSTVAASSAEWAALRLELQLANLNATNAQHLNGYFWVTRGAPATGIGSLSTASTLWGNALASANVNPTIDTTSAQTLDVTVQHSAANAGTRVKKKYAVLELI